MSLASYLAAPPRGNRKSGSQVAGAPSLCQGDADALPFSAPCPPTLTVREPCDSGESGAASTPDQASHRRRIEQKHLLKRRVPQAPRGDSPLTDGRTPPILAPILAPHEHETRHGHAPEL